MTQTCPSHRCRQHGFTLIELMVVCVLALPILAAVMSANVVVREEMLVSEAGAAAAESCRLAGQRLALLARSGLLSTCQVQATQADVDAATLAHLTNPNVVIPAVGDWISPPASGARPTFRFQSADGILSMNASALTPIREFQFIMDPDESDNGLDDNGNGMVDEGRLQLRIGALPVQLVLAGVETCEFSLSGRVLSIHLSCARRDRQGRVYRATTTQCIYMRNN